MGGTVISEVELTGHVEEQFLGRSIDRPAVSRSADENLLEIVGWAIAREGEPVSIDVFDREYRLRTAPIARKREDVAGLFDDRPSALTSGFRTTIGTIGLPHDFELLVRVNFADGRKLPLASIRGRREPLATDYDPQLPPIMVTALGRSGTTMLMHALAACPDIVVGGAYPYELRLARYWLHVAKVLSDPADPNHGPSVDAFQLDLTSVPNNPFFSSPVEPAAVAWFADSQPPLVGELAQRSLDGVYGKLAAAGGGARYFAEKFSPSYSQSIAWELYRERARELFLVRDFRDVLCSIVAFNRKRGFEAFGRGESADDLDFVRRLAGSARTLQQEWEARRDRVHFVRYEDLVTDPGATLRAIGEYLELDRAAIEAMVAATAESSAKMDRHRTSADPATSMGRWREDLTPEIGAACEEAFAGPLEAFGYLERTPDPA
ncbi:MAG TPA: sulfotransferase [Solirubrobacterales bacterium]|nr:sulfotransferase [Solirubrobacterales bacterium]